MSRLPRDQASRCAISFHHRLPIPAISASRAQEGPQPRAPWACHTPGLAGGSRAPPGFRAWPGAALRHPAPRTLQRARAAPGAGSAPLPPGGRRRERWPNHPRLGATPGGPREGSLIPFSAPARRSPPSAITLPSPPARQPLWVPTPEMGVGRQVVRLGARGGLGLSEPASPSPNIEALGTALVRVCWVCTLSMARPGLNARKGMSAAAWSTRKSEMSTPYLLC